MEKAVSGLAMAPRGFNISAPWRHRPDRDVSRRIPGQTLRHCHDACIAPDHGAQERRFARAGAVSGIAHPGAGRGIRQWAGGRVRGMGVAGRLGPSRLVRDVLPESPRVENRTGGSPAGRGMRRVAAVGPARQGVRSSSAVAPCGLRKAGQGPGRQAQGCAAQGGGRAERNRSWSVLFWSGRFRPVVLVLLSGMSRALRGMWIRPTLVCP